MGLFDGRRGKKSEEVDEVEEEKLENKEEGEENKEEEERKPGKRATKKEEEEEEDNDTEAALSLYRALKDPETGIEIIENLARKAGLFEKKKSREEVEDKLESIGEKLLRTELGKDYDLFSKKVGPVFDKIVKHYLDEKFGESEATTTQERWEGEVDKFLETHKMTSKVEGKMKELIEDSPPNLKRKGFNAQKYLSRIYKDSLEELGMEVPKARKSGSKEEEEETPELVERPKPKSITVEDAVEAAMRGIKFRRD